MNLAVLDRLCAVHGIALAYRDAWGNERAVPVETRLALLAAMAVKVTTDAEIEQALENHEAQRWRRPLPPVWVTRTGKTALVLDVALPDACADKECEWALIEEGGSRSGGSFTPRELEIVARQRIAGAGFARYRLALPALPPPGYHRVELMLPRPAVAMAMTLIVAPQRCYLPDAVTRSRVWGPMVNLYAIRSRRNWGIGDFTDLVALIELASASGAGMVGVNPLHALFPHDPEHASPYSPSSRELFNPLYIDCERVPEYAECTPAREAVAAEAFQAELHTLRGADLIDYRRMAQLKLPLLEKLYAHFRAHHLDPATPRGDAFRAFQRAGGDTLRMASAFYALQETLHARDAQAWGWRAWPQEYRDPRQAAVADFARANTERLEFFDYLHWNAELQLDAAGKRALELDLGVGIYQDLAVGADPGGAETWSAQDLYAAAATVGCPPDEFNLKGQDWGILPLQPAQLVETAYAPFIALLRANMRHGGALRIDHVLGLVRLYWIPAGASPERGGYVDYPAEDLLAVLALESDRNHCMVVGEDLGTLPEGLTERLEAGGVLSYRLLYFQRERDGGFSPPERYPAQALASVSTHDLPALRAFWLGRDLDLRARLDLYPSEALRERQVVERAQDRARLLIALDHAKLLPAGLTVHPVSAPDMTPELALAVHRFLARTPCAVLTLQPENIFGEIEQVNMPATVSSQYPNWRHRLALPLEAWGGDERFQAHVAALAAERGAAPARGGPPRRAFKTRIPDATYRLQFNRAFTFSDAVDIVSYLHDLGVSHCYASPYFSARPGSMHGYDIVDHNAFNPEIGTAQDFERFAQALASHGMGQILDVVPNHMGVMGSDNAWWLDVLENGQASTYAEFFDIDWLSPQPQLRGKLLLPVLGDYYGAVLERGELVLAFDRGAGAFSVQYGEHRFPVDPAEYPRILGFGSERLAQRLGVNDPQFADYQGLISSFGHLPPRDAADGRAIEERKRDKEVHKRRLVRLMERSPDLARHIEETVRVMNGEPGRPESFDALDDLLERQAYRLAYWRVASDEINYRRFFDINDLAALRMEDERVFELTHRMVFRLLDEGKIDGLRIDHPDGLHDPLAYFNRLQARYRMAQPENASAGETAGTKPVYVVIEKILADHERMPEQWPVYGTTGYRFGNVVNGLYVDGAAEPQFDRIYRAFTREQVDYEELLQRSKLAIMKTALAAELTVLANRLSRAARADRRTRDFTLNSLREAIAAIVSCFPVYRTYVADAVGPEDRRYIEWAVGAARKRARATDTSVLDFVRDVLIGEAAAESTPARRRALSSFVMRFQQFTAAVTAKGMEDTTFYCYNRLTSLNEVGGEPRAFGMSLPAFHAASLDRARHWPHTMLATSTHDAKRSEDVRARIDVLSELPGDWWRGLQRWRRLNRAKKRKIEEVPAPSANDEYLIYQTLVGTWPLAELDDEGFAAYRGRIERYLLKALREAKVHTSWVNVNEAYESAVTAFVSALIDQPARNAFLAEFVPFARRVARVGLVNSLSQLAIKIASPGVPDFYQGSELWQFQLVDPDNRGPVDYGLRRHLLAELKAHFERPPGEQAALARSFIDTLDDGRAKLLVTWRGLLARREQPRVFGGGEYVPLDTVGEHAERVCAFARIHDGGAAVVVAPRLVAHLVTAAGAPLGREAWSNTRVVLTERLAGRYRNVFTAEHIASGSSHELAVADVLARFPVAILSRASDGAG
ncbi:MAG: malto-oligosyltrehalose synthase [Betaproteobacteria bacterium]|nr:malto-oligosyltrehalose synthase [Betaproteobacteria bacterium]